MIIAGKSIISFSLIKVVSSGQVLDPDAQAFLTATGITDPTIQSAINTLVVGLKGPEGLWGKMNAVYPLVGGTATTHKYNLKDSRDLNVAFRLTYAGNIVHNSNGVTGDWNGTTGTCKITTYVNPSLNFTNNNTHVSVYNRTNNPTIPNQCEIGTDGTDPRLCLFIRWDTNMYADMYSPSSGRITVANPSPLGYYIQTRTSSTDYRIFKNGTQFGSTNTNSNTLNITTVNQNMTILYGGTGNYSGRNLAFATLGSGLTVDESQRLSTLVAQFQTSLGRNV